jgi:hypothetical protein
MGGTDRSVCATRGVRAELGNGDLNAVGKGLEMARIEGEEMITLVSIVWGGTRPWGLAISLPRSGSAP